MPLSRTADGLVVRDQFNRADSNDLGNDWEEWEPAAGDVEIVSEKVEALSATQPNIGAFRPAGEVSVLDDLIVQVNVHYVDGSVAPVRARADGTPNTEAYLFYGDARAGSERWNITRRTGSSNTSVGETTTGAPGAGEIWATRGVIEGTTVRLFTALLTTLQDLDVDLTLRVEADEGVNLLDTYDQTAFQNAPSGAQADFDEFFVCGRNVVVNNVPSGWKVQVDGRAAVVESGGSVTLNVDAWALPATTIKILDASDVEKASFTPTDGVWGGDVYEFTGVAFTQPDRPSITVGELTSSTVELTGSAFSSPSGAGHAASQWQVDEAGGDFSSPVFDSGEDTENLTSIVVTGLIRETDYIARVRYKDDEGDAGTEWSEWSPTGDPGAPAVASRLMLLDASNDDFLWIDFSDPANLVEDAEESIGTSFYAAALDPTETYMWTFRVGEDLVRAFDISTAGASVVLDSRNVLGDTTHGGSNPVFTVRGLWYDRENERLIVTGVGASGDSATRGSYLLTYDVSDPNSIVLIDSARIAHFTDGGVYGGHVWMTDDGLTAFMGDENDFNSDADREQCITVVRLNADGTISGVIDTLQHTPANVGGFSSTGLHFTANEDRTRLAAAMRASGDQELWLTIWDISDPDSISKLGSYEEDLLTSGHGTFDGIVWGSGPTSDRIYMERRDAGTGGNRGILVFDVSDPSNPTITATISASADDSHERYQAMVVSLDGETLFWNAGASLIATDITDETSFPERDSIVTTIAHSLGYIYGPSTAGFFFNSDASFTTLAVEPTSIAGDVRVFMGSGASILSATTSPDEPGATPIQALLRTNEIAPAGAGGEAIFTNLYLVLEATDQGTVTVTPILDGEEITAEATTINVDPGSTRKRLRYEIALGRTVNGVRHALRGTWFAVKIQASYNQSGRPLVLEGLEVEAETVTEGVEDRTFTEEALALRAQSFPAKWFMGVGPKLLEGGQGVSDDGADVLARAETNAVAPAGAGGEAIFTNAYLTIQRDHDSALELQVTPILDGEDQTPIPLSLPATVDPVREEHELPLAVTHSSGGKDYLYAMRGTFFALRIETLGALPSGRVVFEGLEVETEQVTEGEEAVNASA